MQQERERLYGEVEQSIAGGDVDGAIHRLQQLVASHPNFAVARNDLGALLFQRGEMQEAKVHLQQAFQLAPDENYIIANYLEVLLAKRELHEIYPQIKELLVKIQDQQRDLIRRISEYVREEAFAPKGPLAPVANPPPKAIETSEPVSYEIPLMTVGVLSSNDLRFDAHQLGALRIDLINTTGQNLDAGRALLSREIREHYPLWSIFENARSEYVLLLECRDNINAVDVSRLYNLLALSENVAGALVPTNSSTFIGIFRRNVVLSADTAPKEVVGVAELAHWLSLRGNIVVTDPFFQNGSDQTTFGSSGVLGFAGPTRVLMVYDEMGWAWWHRANHIKRNIGSEVEIDVRQMHERVDYSRYDFIFLFDHNQLEDIPALRAVPPSKIILGNSCPKYIAEASSIVSAGKAAAGVTNNIHAWKSMRDSGRWFCCPNGVDLDFFYPSATPAPQKIACWVGNSKSVGNKGLDIIRQACAAAGYELKVIDAVEKKAGEISLSQEQVRDSIYQKASVFICASEFEGTPNPGLEALACGLPVISTSVGNMTELLVDGYNGWLVERTVASIAEALRKHSNSDLEQLRANARESIENGWSWKSQARRYAEIFTQLRAESSASRLQ